MKLQDCIDGEIYYWESTRFRYINWYKKPEYPSDLNIKCYISIDRTNFSFNSARNTNPQNIRLATPEEKHWLLCCVKAVAYISFEDALLSFTPIREPNLEEIKELEPIYKRLLNI